MIPLSPRQSRGKITAAAAWAAGPAGQFPTWIRGPTKAKARSVSVKSTCSHCLALIARSDRKPDRAFPRNDRGQKESAAYVNYLTSADHVPSHHSWAFTALEGRNGKQDTSRALRCHDDQGTLQDVPQGRLG